MKEKISISGGQPHRELRPFLALWATQGLSSLGSSMTSFALIVWSYTQQGSALTTALLSVCTYAPYVLLSVFSGVLSDRWDKKKTMLACDTLAALSTGAVLLLLTTGLLQIWHLYLLNALNGLMNTVQQPASEVAVSLLVPKEHYQRASSLQSLSSSLTTVLTPVFATALFGLGGMVPVILVDLMTFAVAFLTLLLGISFPRQKEANKAHLLADIQSGFAYLGQNLGILELMLFLAAINLVASMFEAALPPMVLSRPAGGEMALGIVSACTGLANVAGSLMVSAAKPPKSRVRVICLSLLFSMSTENLLMAVGRSMPVWCLGAVLGWVAIPLMNANLNVLFRSHIPLALQGRVYAIRNALQFFTIPLGYLLGGFLVDQVFEPLMAQQPPGSLLCWLLGEGKGSGAALLLLILWPLGMLICLGFGRSRHIWALETGQAPVLEKTI